MKRPIYNLEFPPYCKNISISDYVFSRVSNYEDRINQLQQHITWVSEFRISPGTRTHAVTAFVELPNHEKPAVLGWDGANNTALMDVLLLLCLFTGREVFAGEPGTTGYGAETVITRDPRVYPWGGTLLATPIYKPQSNDVPCDVGWEETINEVYRLIRSEGWQRKFHGGYFLFLARQAFQQHMLEAAFIQCWTIWEHLFSILNQTWMSKQAIRNVSSSEKIAFLLVTFAIADEIDDDSHKRIISLADIRNRLIHFGQFPERGDVHDNAVLFIRLTEYLLATILELKPSNVFNTVEKLEAFLTVSKK